MDELPKYRHDVPSFPHKLIDTPLRLVVDFHLEHLERDVNDGKLKPSNLWIVCRGLLLGAMQSYASICVLLADKRPKPFMLQAGIINRAIFETLVNIAALFEDPSRIDVLEREWFKSFALRYQHHRGRFGSMPKWKEYLGNYKQGLETMRKSIGLTIEELNNPSSIAAKWPAPGTLIFGARRKAAPWVSGSRQEVLKRLLKK